MSNTEKRFSHVLSKNSQIVLLISFCLLALSVVFSAFNIFTNFISFAIFTVALTLGLIISPLIAVIGNVLVFTKTRKAKTTAIILAEAIVLIVLGPRCLPYLYASPALSPKNEKIYSAFIEFSDDEKWRDSMELDCFGRVYVNCKNYDVYRSDSDRLREVFTDKKLEEIRQISRMLRKACFYNAIRKGEWVLFYRYNSPTRPRSIGVLYSQNGRNPNELNDDYLKKYGPFVKIDKNRYTSEHLSYNCRTLFLLPVPEQSLINHSEIK